MAVTDASQPTGRAGTRRSRQRRAEVIAGAADLFDRVGYENTSVEDIAHAVGLRKATLYHYFKSKDEILCLIHEEFIDFLISRQEARAKLPMSHTQRLLEIMADMFEVIDTHRGHVRVFMEHYRDLPLSEQETIRRKRDQYEAYVEQEIAEGIKKGELREVDVRLATFAVFGMCSWAYQWYRPEGPMRPRELAYIYWDILLNGIAGAVPREPPIARSHS